MSSDAALNLLNAVRVAASPAARGLGVLTLLNDEIQAAREVTKTSTFRLEAFQTPDLGMLGYADADGEVAIYRRPTRRHAPATEFDVDGLDDLPRVDITYSYAGMDGTAARAAVAAGARGIVSASLAPGLFAEGEKDALLEARRQGVVVVQSSRVLSGRVLDRVWLNEHGILTADNLNPQKARRARHAGAERHRGPGRNPPHVPRVLRAARRSAGDSPHHARDVSKSARPAPTTATVSSPNSIRRPTLAPPRRARIAAGGFRPEG